MPRYYQFGVFLLDKEGFELRRKGHRLPVSGSVFKLLTLFVEHPNELLTRERIAACLWEQPEYVDTATGINTAINRLRATLGENSSKMPYLQTVVGKGYRFVAPVQPLAEPEKRVPAAVATTVSLGVPTPMLPALQAAPVETQTAEPAQLQEAPVAPRSWPSAGPQSAQAREAALPPEGERATEEAGQRRLPDSFPLLGVFARNRWRWPVLAGLLLLLVVGAFLFVHERVAFRKSEAEGEGVSFVQVTFNRETLPVATEALSPDGHRLAYADGNGLFLKELRTSVVTSLLPARTLRVKSLSWSDDGEMLLASGLRSSAIQRPEPEVWRIPLHAAEPTLLLRGGVEAAASSDGKRVAYLSAGRNEIWVAEGDGSKAQLVHSETGGGVLSLLLWSPSTRNLLYQRCAAAEADLNSNAQQRQPCDFESIDARTGRLLSSQKGAHFSSAYALADGHLLLARDLVDEWSRAALFSVWLRARTDEFLGTPVLLQKLPGDSILSISAARNGDPVSALIRRRSPEVDVGDLTFPGPTLENVRRLPHVSPETYPHSWSDNDTVLVESDDEGQFALYKQHADASPAQLLARAPKSAILPQLSPDRQWVLFEGVQRFPKAHAEAIYRVPVEGGAIEQLPTKGEILDFACPASESKSQNKCLVRERSGNFAVYYALDPASGQGPELLRLPLTADVMGDWSLSPDASTIAVVSHDPENPALELHGLDREHPVRVLPLQLPEPGRLLSANWDPLGRGYLAQVKTGVGYDLLFLDPEGHGVLLRRMFAPTWGVPSHDGKHVAFVDEMPYTNVWLGVPVPEPKPLAEGPGRYLSLQAMLARRN